MVAEVKLLNSNPDQWVGPNLRLTLNPSTSFAIAPASMGGLPGHLLEGGGEGGGGVGPQG